MILLYVLFVPVALWLLTEAMWQHGAPFRYRILALAGFGGVVVGVAAGNGIISGAGGLLFVIGQFLVTRYVRSGYYHGWTVRFGRKRARRARHGRPTEPVVRETEYPDSTEYSGYGEPVGFEKAAGYAAQPGHFADDSVDDDPFAEYDAYRESGLASNIPEKPSHAPAYAGYDATPPGGYPGQDAAYGRGYAPASTHGPEYDTGGHAAVYPAPYGDAHTGGPDSGAYPTIGFATTDPSGQFGTQPGPMSSAANAAPMPAPTNPPPGWAPAPTAYNPDTDERLG